LQLSLRFVAIFCARRELYCGISRASLLLQTPLFCSVWHSVIFHQFLYLQILNSTIFLLSKLFFAVRDLELRFCFAAFDA
jgi:hypothetical protein